MAGGRNKLSDAEKEARRLEREQMFGPKKSKTPKSLIQDNMAEETNTNNTGGDQNQGGDQNTNVNSGTGTENQGGGDQNQGGDQNTNTNTSTGTENQGGGGGDLSEAAKFQPNKTWKPFKGDRIERSYATPAIDQNLLTTEIPEANINIAQNNVTAENAQSILDKGPQDDQSQKPAEIKKPDPVNSEWNQMSPQEQKDAAKLATDMALGVYDKLHYFGRMYIKVDEEEIIEMHNDDKIDMNAATVENDEDPDKEVTIKEFWQDFNKQVDERFIVSENFKAEVRPPMERLCMKYGLGAGDGLYLAFKFGEDAATKLAMLAGFKKTVNKMNEHFIKQHSKFKAEVQAQVDAELAKRAAIEEQKLKVRAVAAGLPENATLDEIIAKEQEGKKS